MKNIMRYFQVIFDDLKRGENFDLYATVVAALALALLNLFGGIPQSWVDSVNLAVLALLANASLGLRHRLKGFVPSGIKIDKRRGFTTPFEDLLRGAKHVDIFGLSLLGVITSYGGSFSREAQEDCQFRFLLVDPDSDAVSTAVGSVEDPPHRRDIKKDIETSVDRLEILRKTGNVEFEFTPFAPSFSLLIVDPGRPHGETHVELYGYGISPDDRPHFVLTQANEPWYDFFTQQFNRLWNAAREHKVRREASVHHPESSASQTSEV